MFAATAVLFLFFPKILYSLVRFYFKYLIFTLPITVGIIAGIISFNLLVTLRSFWFVKEYESLVKPIFMVAFAVAFLNFTLGFKRKS